MREFSEEKIEEIEDSIIETIDDNLNYISNKLDLLDLLIEDLNNRREEYLQDLKK